MGTRGRVTVLWELGKSEPIQKIKVEDDIADFASLLIVAKIAWHGMLQF